MRRACPRSPPGGRARSCDRQAQPLLTTANRLRPATGPSSLSSRRAIRRTTSRSPIANTAMCTAAISRAGGTVVIPASRGGDLRAYLDSLNRIRALRPRRLLPGHGPIVEGEADALIARYIAHRAQRERQVVAALRRGRRSPAEMVEEIYGALSSALEGAAVDSVLAHLRKLEQDGVAASVEGRWGRWPLGWLPPWRHLRVLARCVEPLWASRRESLARAPRDTRRTADGLPSTGGRASAGGGFRTPSRPRRARLRAARRDAGSDCRRSASRDASARRTAGPPAASRATS